MKITSKKVDDLNQILTLSIEAADYEQARKKKLNELQKKAEIPGFRKGKVPASLIEKFYGESALGEAVNTVVGEALQNYVNDKKLNIIGEPLPVEEKLQQEWKAGNDFKFQFEIGLTPEINLEFAKTDELPFYNVTISEEDKNKLAEGYKKQQEAAEAAAKEQGQEAPAAMSDEELAKQVESQLKNDYKQAAEFRFEKDVRDFCVKKADVKVPEKFLRRWLIVANEGKFTAEDIDKDFPGFIEDYKWQLCVAALTKKFEVKLEEKDLMEEAKNFARYQYSMYGIMNVPEDALESFAKNILQDQNNFQRIVENVQTKKVIAAVKEQITVKSKKISTEKFRDLK
ncbi:MAG: trigger factor family protein [Bacteroidales bacterium]|nr:trigger factor family protein [Bacteroidales bacterium]